MNPDDYRDNIWEYQRLDEIYHQQIDAIRDYYYNDDNFDDEANVKRYSERQMDMNIETEKERLRVGFERKFEKEITELIDEIDNKEDEIRHLKQEIADMKKDIKLIEKMKELLKQYALYSEIDFDEETLTLLV